MKIRSFLWAITLSAVGAFSGMAWAQDADAGQDTAAGPGSGAGMRGRLNFLTADEKAHLMRVHRQVMAENPDLKTEQESLQKEREYVHGKGTNATADDKGMLRDNFMAHNEKMTAAMVKDDPSVQPILDKVKAHMQKRFQDGAGGSGAGGDTDNQ